MVMPTSDTSAPTIGSPVVTEVTFPSMVPVCAASRDAAGRDSKHAAIVIGTEITRIMSGSSLTQERCGYRYRFSGGNATGARRWQDDDRIGAAGFEPATSWSQIRPFRLAPKHPARFPVTHRACCPRL